MKNKKVARFVNREEKNDPVPMKSAVLFKKPLSAHERVMRAIKTHAALQQMAAEPGDEDFDSPMLEELTPHQLIHDPATGKEMTAGEYVMLQHERAEARRDVQKAAISAATKKASKRSGGSNLPAEKMSEDDKVED